MTTLLAVDTSGRDCSLAIHVSGRWLEDTQPVDRLHNRVVLGNLDRLVARAGLSRRDFAAVAFAAGPGSFTGVRMAAAVAQGVAFACHAAVVPVSSSLVMAVAGQRDPRLGETARGLVTVIRSRREASYLAAFTLEEAAPPRRVAADHLHQGARAPAELRGSDWIGVGDRPDWWPADRRFIVEPAVTAVVVGELALAELAGGGGLAPHQALPVYVTGDSPWRPVTS